MQRHVPSAGGRWDLPVENLDTSPWGDEESGVLLPGHPGRISDDTPQDVGVTWSGLGEKPVSSLYTYSFEGLGELTEQEYFDRVERIRQGLPPVG